MDSFLWKGGKYDIRSAWIDLYLRANHAEGKVNVNGQIVRVCRGQFITSEVKLSDFWGWDRGTTRRFLKKIEEQGMIIKKVVPRKYIVITIVNYNMEQGNTEGTTSREVENTIVEDFYEQEILQEENNKQTSIEQQTNINNNKKNVKNKNNKKNINKEDMDDISEILLYWKRRVLKEEERELSDTPTDELIKTITGKNGALSKYGKDSILNAIDRYATVCDNIDFYYNADFTLIRFLKQKNTIPRFLEGYDEQYNGDIWRGYINSRADSKTCYNNQIRHTNNEYNEESLESMLFGDKQRKYDYSSLEKNLLGY